MEALSGMGILNRRKERYNNDSKYSILAPDPGFDYRVPITWRARLGKLTRELNEVIDRKTDREEIMSSLLFHALDVFDFTPLEGGKDSPAWIMRDDGYKEEEVKIVFNWPIFLARRLVPVTCYRSYARSTLSEHALIKYLLLDAIRRGKKFVIETLEEYRKIVSVIEDAEKKEAEKNAKSENIGRDAVNSSVAKHSG